MTQTTDRPVDQAPEALLEEDYGVPWALEEHHLEWQRAMRDFCTREVAPGATERSIEGRFDADLARAAGRLGAYGLLAPEQFGGGGADLRTLCLAAEELARVDSSLAVTVHVQAISVALLAHLAGSRRPAAPRCCPAPARARRSCPSASPSRPAAPTPATSRRPPGATGRLGDQRRQAVHHQLRHPVLALRHPLRRHRRCRHAGHGAARPRPVSAFLVPLDAPGVTVGGTYAKMGWRASDTHPLFFDEVRLPADALLGEEGRGYREALAFLTWARLPIAAMSTGPRPAAASTTRWRFVSDRTSFGDPLGGHQAVAFQLADIAALASPPGS